MEYGSAPLRYKILLLEDGPEDRELYRRLLLKWKGIEFAITEADNVEKARQLTQQERFDCCVVDYQLPDADGIAFIRDFTARGREDSAEDATALVMVTGQGSEEVAVEALKLGAHDYITKKNISDGVFVRPLLNAIERAQLTEKVRHYQKELERSHEELSVFTHTASHDLKAPLRRITSYCDILNEDAAARLNDEDKRILERMILNARRMQQLIDTLLSYSLIQSAKEALETVSLDQMVREIIDEFEPQIRECGAQIDVQKLPEITVYPFRMRQLWSNLISNALKYRSEKPPRIIISAREQDSAIEFRVADNGQGIPAEHQKDIFADFKRLHSQEDVEGTGLGLPICRKIVKMHGGRIGVESTPGEGSTFFFTIPV